MNRSIYFGQSGRVSDYGAVVKGAKASVRIVIDFADPGDLGYLLQQLGEIVAEQKRADRSAPRRRSGPLLLEHFGDDE